MSTMGTELLAGRYALLGVLGAGGMATVYRARDEVLGREVAVKVLSHQYAGDAAFLGRFEREARHIAALSHPRIVTVFDCGVDGSTPFIVMELVAGWTLRQVLDNAGRLPPGEAVAIAVAVCEALEAAHAAGLVHRDVKPENIVLSNGEVKVLDFGISRLQDAAGGTRTGTVLGTVAYLSPEQASGRAAGPQSDLYSLGCVLFEMLAGAPPFSGDSAVGVAYQHVHDDPGPPSAWCSGLPPRLDVITSRLLAKNPADRPPGAAAARAALLSAPTQDRTQDRTQVLGLPASDPDGAGPPYRSAGPPYRRRRPTMAEALLAAALAVTVAALAVVLLTIRHGPVSGPPASPGRSTSHQPPKVSPSEHPGTSPPAHQASLPPTASAAGAFVGDLQAGVADGQVTARAAQDLFNRLQQVLFARSDQSSEQVDQRFSDLVQTYDHYQSKGELGGPATAVLRHDLDALGTAIGVP